MRKRCPEHGQFEALVYGDARAYTSSTKFNKPGTIPLAFSTPRAHGCPHDCGLCPDHQQHACLGIIEVNSACNMECPLCFANAGAGFNLTLEEVEGMLDHLVATEGNPEVVQFSGMDPWTFNQKNLMKCCKEILLPDGKQIPFCAYNSVGYREQAREQLAAHERARNRARRDGTTYTAPPLTFTFDQPVGQARPVDGSKRQRVTMWARARENGQPNGH